MMNATIEFPVSITGIVTIPLNDGKAIVSKGYLKSTLGTAYTFESFNAVIEQSADPKLIQMKEHIDVEGKVHFILDSSLSAHYVVLIHERSDQGQMKDMPMQSGPSQTIDLDGTDADDECDDHIFHMDTPTFGVQKMSNATTIELDSPLFCRHDVTMEQEIKSDATMSSAITLILSKSGSSILAKLLGRINTHKQLEELPRYYDGDIVFEFPATFGKFSGMHGMEHKFDGHIWTKPVTSNVAFTGIVRVSYCVGVFECSRLSCSFKNNNCQNNRAFFTGSLKKRCSLGVLADNDGSITCNFCKKHATCVDTCACMAYYVMPNDPSTTRLMIHVGHHMHEVQPGTSKKSIEKTRELVASAIKADMKAGPRKVQMIIAKDLITKSLVRVNRKMDEVVGDVELANILDELTPLVQNRRLRKMVSKAKSTWMPLGDGLDSLLHLKKNSMYDFFHGSRFPGQGSSEDRCFVFKMSTKGPASGVDLVNRMRRSGNGDLKNTWVQFDHTRRVIGWSTMACHVYDPSIQELLTIATCEMKEEDTEAQILFWEMLNEVMERQGHAKANFFGFMADEAQANWRALRTVYNGDPDNVMEGRERSCLFHWEQSLVRHTTAYILKEYQDEHKAMCEKWRTSPTKEAALEQYRVIRQWWRIGRVKECDIAALDSWLSWWNLRIPHWGDFMVAVLDSEDAANTPRTNLSESKHGSWLAGEGNKGKLSLYDAAVTDMANALLQSAKQHAYLEGKHLGAGPSLENLIDRSSSRKKTRPEEVARTVRETTIGTPMYHHRTCLEGDRETVRQKRRPSIVVDVEDGSSHRPEYNYVNKNRREKGRPKRINFQADGSGSRQVDPMPSTSQEVGDTLQDGQIVVERKIHNSFWAIRRTSINSRVKCMGWIQKEGKCNRMIVGSTKGTPAPSFFSTRTHVNGKTQQMMWFCNNDCTHTWTPDKNINPIPGKLPNIWPVLEGTNLSQVEVDVLTLGGFQLEVKPVNGTNKGKSAAPQESEGCARKTKPPTNVGNMHVKFRSKISKAAQTRIERALKMNATVLTEKIVKDGQHEIFEVETDSSLEVGLRYDVHISTSPSCTCPDFQKRVENKKSYMACKHLYFVFLRIMGLDQQSNMFIHQPILREAEVFQALHRGRTYP